MLSKIGIGIPTKDRWDDLGVTLQKLEEFGLGSLETIVMDDASQVPAPAALRARFPRVRFERSEQPRFAAAQRNRLAQLLSTPYFLHLDNDSFPVHGDLAEAVSWLDSHADAFALAFIITERTDFLPRLRTLPAAPFPCLYFVGCGALLKRELFLSLGGYDECLQYYTEEVALTLKARSRDLFVYQYPGVVIHHNRSLVLRDNTQRARLVTRNELIIAILYYPFLFSLIRWPAFILKALVYKWGPRWGTIQGVIAALKLFPKSWSLRRPISTEPFRVWKKLPTPITIR